jgi:hypothetical protein
MGEIKQTTSSRESVILVVLLSEEPFYVVKSKQRGNSTAFAAELGIGPGLSRWLLIGIEITGALENIVSR